MNILDSNIIIYSSQTEYAYLRELIFSKENYVSKISQLEVLGFHRLNRAEKKILTPDCFAFRGGGKNISLWDKNQNILR